MNNQERQEMKLMEQRYEYGVFAVTINHGTENVYISGADGADGAGGQLRVSFDHVVQLREMLYQAETIIDDGR